MGPDKKNTKLLPVIFIASATVFYILVVRRLGFGIPCLFHRVTGFKCGGCGTTTMLVALFNGDPRSAYSANPFIFLTLPFLGFEAVYLTVCSCKGRRMAKWNKILLDIYAILLVLWSVLRNLIPSRFFFSFL
ncbi:MAG: DUF2752 domain-containing protein [Lachnospiraceae bacterium]|nr:DUF2752 domain-containing protein [Lachnospiraceae bacterium]